MKLRYQKIAAFDVFVVKLDLAKEEIEIKPRIKGKI
jgi:hypothetical protein